MGHAEDVEQGLKTFSMAKQQDIQKMLIKAILAVNETLETVSDILALGVTTHQDIGRELKRTGPKRRPFLPVQDDEGEDEPGPPRDYFKGE